MFCNQCVITKAKDHKVKSIFLIALFVMMRDNLSKTKRLAKISSLQINEVAGWHLKIFGFDKKPFCYYKVENWLGVCIFFKCCTIIFCPKKKRKKRNSKLGMGS